jgi:hypothetical protein
LFHLITFDAAFSGYPTSIASGGPRSRSLYEPCKCLRVYTKHFVNDSAEQKHDYRANLATDSFDLTTNLCLLKLLRLVSVDWI